MISGFVNFKSTPDNFKKEKDDLKNSTIREIDLNDSRFLFLISAMYDRDSWKIGDLKIGIINTETLEHFLREIRDITIFKNLMIITWNEKDKVK